MKRSLKFFLWGLLAILVVTGLSRMRFEVDLLRLLPSDLRQVEGLSYFLKTFVRPTEMILTLKAEDADQAEASALSLASYLQQFPQWVEYAVARPPWEESEQKDENAFLAYLFLNAPTEKIREAVERITPDRVAFTLVESKEEIADSGSPMEVLLLTRDPYRFHEALGEMPDAFQNGGGEFTSEDGKFRAIYIGSAQPLGNYRDTIAWVSEIQKLVDAWEGRDAKVKMGWTGEPVFVAEISSKMQWEMMSSGVLSLFFVGGTFWIFQRRFLPVMVLWGVLVCVYFFTLAIAGWVLSELTVIGAGFASIMVGLGVDYGYLLYQDWRTHGGDAKELRKRSGPAIWSAAITTAAAFFSLNFSGLPGLSQLGNLVGIGILVAAVCMQTLFIGFLARSRFSSSTPSLADRIFASSQVLKAGTWGTSFLVVFLIGALLILGFPKLEFSMKAFRTRYSQAQATLDQLQAHLLAGHDWASLIVVGKNETEVAQRLQEADSVLKRAQEEGRVLSYMLPVGLWANPERQTQNLKLLGPLEKESDRLQSALLANGFSEEAFALSHSVLGWWKRWSLQAPPIWPDDATSRWIFRRLISHHSPTQAAMGAIELHHDSDPLPELDSLDGVFLTGWNLLALELKEKIPSRFIPLTVAIVFLLFLLLLVIFRNLKDVVALVLSLSVVFIALNGGMALLGMEWNFFNLAAILLLLGTGVDYGIYMLIALRRQSSHVAYVQRSMAKTIFLCAASAVVGFGSISWFSHYGLASLGRTCALGLAIDALVSVYLLPPLWKGMRSFKMRKLIFQSEKMNHR